MAKSYFKYQQRDAGAQINWNTVGQSVVKTLNDVVEDREKRKAELDQLSADLGDILQEQPAGTHKGANVFAQQHSSHAKEMAGIYNAALKSGRMSPKDFKMRMQALTDGTGQIFDVAEKYQAEYGKFLERTKGGANQEIERYFAERMEGFAKLNDIDSFIDPTTGQVSLGKLVEVGGLKTLSKNPGDIKSIVQLNNILSQKFDRYDLTKDLKKEVDTLGSFIKTVANPDGSITQISDPTKKEKFEKVENDIVSSIMANPYNVSSILTENLVRNPKTGKTYKITESLDGIPKEERDDYILVTVDGNGRLIPEYTKGEGGQEEVVREAIKTKFKSMIDSERVSKRGAFAPTRESSTERSNREQQENLINNWVRFATGDEATQQAALDTIMGSDLLRERGLVRIKVSDDGKTLGFEYLDSDANRTVRIPEGNSLDNFLSAVMGEGAGMSDLAVARGFSGIKPEDFNYSVTKDFDIMRSGATNKPFVFDDYYSGKIETTLFQQDEADAAQQINNLLQGTGLTAEFSGGPGRNNKVVIKKGGAELMSFDTSTQNTKDTEAQRLKGELLSIITGNVSPEKKKEVVDRLGLTQQQGELGTGGASESGGVAR